MKIIYQGDLHLRNKAPVNRSDDYITAQWKKLEELMGFCNRHEATLLLGGDIFDTYKVSPETVNMAIDIFNVCDQPIYAVLGQHDVPYHMMDLKKSPVYSLVKGVRNFQSVRGSGSSILFSDWEEQIIVHYCSWEAKPKPLEIEEFSFNILLGHISVMESIPFYWKGEGYTPDTLREKYPDYDLYLCGDIHVPLIDDSVVVSGPMMRQAINEIALKPRCYLINIDNPHPDAVPLYYTIESNVFHAEEIAKVSPLDLTNLIEALKTSAVGRASYKRDCLALAAEKPQVRTIIERVFDELD